MCDRRTPHILSYHVDGRKYDIHEKTCGSAKQQALRDEVMITKRSWGSLARILWRPFGDTPACDGSDVGQQCRTILDALAARPLSIVVMNTYDNTTKKDLSDQGSCVQSSLLNLMCEL